MDLLDTFQITATGLSAQRLRLQTVASNMANARTTRTEDGGPYSRKMPVFEARAEDPFGDRLDQALHSVKVTEVVSSDDDPVRVYDPGHPDADGDGYVSYPDINILEEMVDLMTTSRTYEANATVLDVTKDMASRALNIGS